MLGIAVLLMTARPVTRPQAPLVPSRVLRLADGVYEVRDDNGHWAADMSRDITHQNAPPYQARKVLDLSGVPERVWRSLRAVGVSAYFMVRDYSASLGGPANGLDEAYEIALNGVARRFATGGGAPAWDATGPPTMAWHDHEMPVEALQRGRNEIVLRKAQGSKADDYLYLGIDLTAKRGRSAVTFDGTTWRSDVLTVPGGAGEYMVRLLLLTRDLSATAEWRPGGRPGGRDPHGLVAYAGPAPEADRAGELQVEWDSRRLDRIAPLRVRVDGEAPVAVAWLDAMGRVGEWAVSSGGLEWRPGTGPPPSGVALRAVEGPRPPRVRAVRIEGALAARPPAARIDMRPAISRPPGSEARRRPAARRSGKEWVLENARLRARFAAGRTLRLLSLRNEITATEMVRRPEEVALFLVEVEGRRLAASRDFRCSRLSAVSRGFVANLVAPGSGIIARLTARIDAEGLRLGLSLRNAGPAPLQLKVAFPHLAGLAVSRRPSDDYYFYPWGGGIIASAPALIRAVYGDHQALYQLVDIFSPSRGGGLALRLDDAGGWHKGISLRKWLPGAEEVHWDRVATKTAPETLWTNSLPEAEGAGIAVEYQRRARAPGGVFKPADAVLFAHAGDWRVPMRAYAAWAHRVWRFRPAPSRLARVHQMIARGWAGDLLFRDGRYRDDLVEPAPPGLWRTPTECLEVMSWWEWSTTGPWGAAFDRLSERLTPEQIATWQPYFVRDPVTGQTMWNNQPGDYRGYNARFGGLPAFREAVRGWQRAGAMVTLYTDPFRLDGGCETGARYGRAWSVVGPDGRPTNAYDVWNPCHCVAHVRRWVAETIERVCRETGADGVRLDEYGHAGWACFSREHAHTYAEPGVSQWNKAVAETTRLVRAAMDRLRPGLVLTTEHPGYDYLMPAIEGCITYDTTVLASPLRPLECNLQRFFFPECKPYELDYRPGPLGPAKKLWNAVGSFGTPLPLSTLAAFRENEAVYASRNCDPLVPTSARHIYANRFGPAGPDRIALYHLYNATGHTFAGIALRRRAAPGRHLADLFTGEDLGRADGTVRLRMARDTVACVADLPRLLRVERSGSALRVHVASAPRSARLAVCSPLGTAIRSLPARAGWNQIDLGALQPGERPACVKLLAGERLADIAAIPR